MIWSSKRSRRSSWSTAPTVRSTAHVDGGGLIRADGASKRRDILGRRWKTISADCRTVVEDCRSSKAVAFCPAARAALDAWHPEAAKALAGTLIDEILTAYFGKNRTKYTPHPQGKRTKDAYDEFNVRQFIAFAPMWQTYQQFFATNGDKVPTTFSRNATARTVSPRQFNRRNAVQGLMVACSLLRRLDEEAQGPETATSVSCAACHRASSVQASSGTWLRGWAVGKILRRTHLLSQQSLVYKRRRHRWVVRRSPQGIGAGQERISIPI